MLKRLEVDKELCKDFIRSHGQKETVLQIQRASGEDVCKARLERGEKKEKKKKKKLPAKLKLLLSYIALGYAQRSTLDGLIAGKNNGIKVFFSSVCPRPPRGCAAPSPPAHGECWPLAWARTSPAATRDRTPPQGAARLGAGSPMGSSRGRPD